MVCSVPRRREHARLSGRLPVLSLALLCSGTRHGFTRHQQPRQTAAKPLFDHCNETTVVAHPSASEGGQSYHGAPNLPPVLAGDLGRMRSLPGASRPGCCCCCCSSVCWCCGLRASACCCRGRVQHHWRDLGRSTAVFGSHEATSGRGALSLSPLCTACRGSPRPCPGFCSKEEAQRDISYFLAERNKLPIH